MTMTAEGIGVIAEPKWFEKYRGIVLGHTFLGDRVRMHIAEVVAEAPGVLRLKVLCNAGGYSGVDVSTTVINTSLDHGSSQKSCRQWWDEKISLAPNQTLSRVIPGGLRKPRICGDCQKLREAD